LVQVGLSRHECPRENLCLQTANGHAATALLAIVPAPNPKETRDVKEERQDEAPRIVILTSERLHRLGLVPKSFDPRQTNRVGRMLPIPDPGTVIENHLTKLSAKNHRLIIMKHFFIFHIHEGLQRCGEIVRHQKGHTRTDITKR
jgi:hypothetical protein